MMRVSKSVAGRLTAMAAILALLSACGGGGSGSVGGGGGGGGTGATPTPSPSGTCSLRARQDWVAARMNEWYLFPETLPTGLNPAAYSTVEAYLDALTATARAQRKDRFFTYITSIAEENAYYNSGSSAGFGFRLALDGSNRLVITESFEGAPALNGGVDRGAEIVSIGTNSSNLRTVSSILASEGTAGLNNALGSPAVGLTRVFQVRDGAGTRNVTLAMADFTLTPVSSRYGAKVIDDAGRKVGYVNLRTFINTAESPLRNAFANFRAQGITEVIIDLRYNGGGLISIADLMNNLLGADRTTSTVANYVTFRPSKASENETVYFAPQAQSIAPTRIAFIGTGGSASASELVMNTFIPYLGNRSALVGTNTYGKPVGQIALDQAACDDRLRVIAFALENANHQGAYYDGLAAFMGATCRASDDITRQMGDPAEASTRAALDFLAGRSCTAIASASASAPGLAPQSAGAQLSKPMELVTPDRPTTPQREVPGLF
ncbi:S41 family peptidase [Sphingomonas sp. BT-65]|uniref:S41 family peptidase n=1 Tax=Sphingomonas sp. BT-65 TaxID=2989821 RepID=UPI0022354ABD|nr:S41 family peptidase [Sphingomonas sp. BT-65]MCW4463482.1 S41 family peptidase [Sphingomonas sp. BT-65]